MVERVRRADALAWVESDERVVVVRLSDPAADPLVLADSAAVVWWAVDEGATVSDVVAEVAAAYDVEPGVVEADVRALIAQAGASGILQISDDGHTVHDADVVGE